MRLSGAHFTSFTSTNTDAAGGAWMRSSCAHFTVFTGTKVQILTLGRTQACGPEGGADMRMLTYADVC